MIAARYRFHGYGSLRAVYQRGQNIRGPLLNLRIAQRPVGKPSRCAVVVSRKVSKSAVVRNRIRRRIYESVRPLIVADSFQPSADLVFTVFDERLASIDHDKLQVAVKDLLDKARTALQTAK